MSQRRAGNINRCENCRINRSFCVCDAIKPLSISSKISLIVHVRELTLTSNTAQFIKKMIPNESHIFIRGQMNDNFTPDEMRQIPGRALFLYPHEDSIELNDDFKDKYPGPYHLVIPDGNWQQARKVRKREVYFQEMIPVKLPTNVRGEYYLRKAPQDEWVSTYEAVSHALKYLESSDTHEKLMAFFRVWVRASLNARSGDFSKENIAKLQAMKLGS